MVEIIFTNSFTEISYPVPILMILPDMFFEVIALTKAATVSSIKLKSLVVSTDPNFIKVLPLAI